jgi:hypothetical protein
VFVREVRGLQAFWLARGGFIETSTLRSRVVEVPRDILGFHVSELEDKMRLEFSQTQGDIVSLGVQRMLGETMRRVYALASAACLADAARNTDAGAGALVSSVDDALRLVHHASEATGLTIMGSTVTMDVFTEQLTAANQATNGAKYGGYIPQTNEEYLRRGLIGSYKGNRLVGVPPYKDDGNNLYFPHGEIFIIAPDSSKWANYGGLMSKEYVEPDNWYWHYLAKRDMGGLVYRPDRMHLVNDTATTYPTG